MLPAASCASLRGQPRSEAAWKSASVERSERRGLLNAGRGGVEPPWSPPPDLGLYADILGGHPSGAAYALRLEGLHALPKLKGRALGQS